jgi:hypothetical protein
VSHQSENSGVSERSRKSKATSASKGKGASAKKPAVTKAGKPKKSRQPSVATTALEVSSSDDQSSEDEKCSDNESKYTYVTATATAVSSNETGAATLKSRASASSSDSSSSDSDSASSSSSGTDVSETSKAKPSLDDEALVEMIFNGVTANKDNTIRLAVMSGADVNGVNKDGWTPLQIAAFLRHTDALKQLLESPGIQVNKPGQYGMRAVHFAASIMGNKPLAVVDKPECMQVRHRVPRP